MKKNYHSSLQASVLLIFSGSENIFSAQMTQKLNISY